MAGPLIAGMSFDFWQDYGPGFLTVAAMFVIAIGALTQARPAARAHLLIESEAAGYDDAPRDAAEQERAG